VGPATTGLIVGAYRRRFEVELTDRSVIVCTVKGRSLAPACGDIVELSRQGDRDGVVTAIAPRRSVVARQDAWRQKTVAANVDTVIGVVAVDPPYNPELVDRWTVASEAADARFVLALNKVDLPDARAVAGQAAGVLARRGLTVCQVSAATREGLRELAFAIAAVVAEVRSAAPAAEPTRRIIRPQPTSGPEFEIEQTGPNAFLVRGAKPWRWVQQTDFANEEAVGYLADRLAKLGVEEALAGAGADDGAEVLIGNGEDAVVFDWAPDIPSGERHGLGPRGTDRRLPR